MTAAPRHQTPDAAREIGPPPLALRLFCLALMMPAMAINAAMIALVIAPLAVYGTSGLLVAGAIGGLLGIWPARWLARKIHEGLSEGT